MKRSKVRSLPHPPFDKLRVNHTKSLYNFNSRLVVSEVEPSLPHPPIEKSQAPNIKLQINIKRKSSKQELKLKSVSLNKSDPTSVNQPKIIYESPEFVAVDKPAGLLTHAIPTGKGRVAEPTLVDWLLPRYPELSKVGDNPRLRPGIVHRLDRDTSGIILIPRTQTYFSYLKSLFQTGQIKKTYLALVAGIPEPATGRIDRPIGIKSGSVKRSIHSRQMRKEAVTNYETSEVYPAPDESSGAEGKGFALLLVLPQTGRTHQIRVHLKSIEHPIVGDRLYGFKKQPKWVTRLYLHAAELRFESEPNIPLELQSPPPPEFESVCIYLRK